MGLTIPEILAGLAAAQLALESAVDTGIAALEGISPDSIKSAEEQARKDLDAAIAKLGATADDVQVAVANAVTVIEAGKGPTAGGLDATLS